MNRERYTPDGVIVDWDKQQGVSGKYHAVILIGGKGAQKSLWDDDIVPRILIDHYRAGRIIGALGAALVNLARASLVTDEAATPEYEPALKELEALGVNCVDEPVVCLNRIVTGSGGKTAEQFAEKIVELLWGN